MTYTVSLPPPPSDIVVDLGRVARRGVGYSKQLGTVERRTGGWFACSVAGVVTGPHASRQAAAESLA